MGDIWHADDHCSEVINLEAEKKFRFELDQGRAPFSQTVFRVCNRKFGVSRVVYPVLNQSEIVIYGGTAFRFCLVPRRRYSADKQGARGVVGRMQNAECTYPTTPHTPPNNKKGRLGTRQVQIGV